MYRVNVREVDLSITPEVGTPVQTALVGAFDLPIPSELPVSVTPDEFRRVGSTELSLIADSLVDGQEVTVIRPRGETQSLNAAFVVVGSYNVSFGAAFNVFYLMFLGYDPQKGYTDVSYVDVQLAGTPTDTILFSYSLDGSSTTHSLTINLNAPSVTLPSNIVPLFFYYEPYTGSLTLQSSVNYSGLTLNYTVSKATTPWVYFAEYGTPACSLTLYKGFYLEGIDLNSFNKQFVVSIENITVNREKGQVLYPSFDVVVHFRDIRGVSANTEYIRFRQVNLNPESPNYIERVIGNMTFEFDGERIVTSGEYPNQVPFLRVVVSQDIKQNVAGVEKWVPVGFEGIYSVGDFTVIVNELTNVSIPVTDSAIIPPMRFTRIEQITLSGGASFSVISNQPYGFNIQDSRHSYWLSPFKDDELIIGTELVLPALDVSTEFGVSSWEEALPEFSFLMPFQGGSDGYIRVDENEPDTIGRVKITPALLANYERLLPLLTEDQFDLVLTPYLTFADHAGTVNAFINRAENRFLYLFDIAGDDDTENLAISLAGYINSSFATTFFPWVRRLTNKGMRTVPASLAAYRSIRTTDPETGLAPVGARRGVVTGEPVRQVDWEDLYNNRINPIVRVGNDVLLFGQKTMLNVNSALNRINVRRLLIAMRNRISQILSSYLFENNTSENRLRAEALVRQYLESLRLRGAVTDYEVAIDSVTTPTDIDNNTLRARVTVQPARSIEYIDITFVITPTGVEIT